MEIISVIRGDNPSDPWRLSPSTKGIIPSTPLNFLDRSQSLNLFVSLICSFQSDGLFHAVGSEELEQGFLVFPLHQYVGAEVFYGDSVYCYQVIACTDSFLVGR